MKLSLMCLQGSRPDVQQHLFKFGSNLNAGGLKNSCPWAPRTPTSLQNATCSVATVLYLGAALELALQQDPLCHLHAVLNHKFALGLHAP